MARTYYLWDEENDTLLAETDEAGNTIAEYTHEPGRYGPLISQRRNGETRYYHYDGQGNTRALTDESGTVTDTYTYTALGEVVASSGTTTNPFRYKGELGYYANLETDDLYVRARTYSPAIGRWLSQDPIRDEENVYRYVRNAPVAFVDPSGQQLRPIVTEPGLDPAPPFPCADLREWWPGLCPCCKCSETSWGSFFDFWDTDKSRDAYLKGLTNVSVRFVRTEDMGGNHGYSLTCHAKRSPTKGPKWWEHHLFVYIDNRRTCEALAMLAHEFKHVKQFYDWANTKGPPNELPWGQKVNQAQLEHWEREAYLEQCEVMAEQDCVPTKDRTAHVKKCVKKFMKAGWSTDPAKTKNIGPQCKDLISKEANDPDMSNWEYAV